MTSTFSIHTIAADSLDRARLQGTDTSGNPVAHLLAAGGEPLRCCLRDAEPGEACILFGYEPRLPASPYRELGAVFTHAESCEGPQDFGAYPPAWLGRPQVLRAYDARGWIHESTRVHDGTDPASVISEIFASGAVEQIHSRNIAHGCYMFTITRA